MKVDARIPDQFNEKEFYRFTADKIYSEIGKTITLPSYNPRSFNIAFCSCSNYPAGFFNSYKEIAENTDIHLVLHLRVIFMNMQSMDMHLLKQKR